jgi:hypothetical protein
MLHLLQTPFLYVVNTVSVVLTGTRADGVKDSTSSSGESWYLQQNAV